MPTGDRSVRFTRRSIVGQCVIELH
uniref:Uncharacterized protein n=1 Tax=Anguilla anguilla TaxID=7936 RepID=A0A0E9UV46_ANGAN